MIDDDVICLSSDDEIPSDEIPKKKPKFNDTPSLRPKAEIIDSRDVNVAACKRKSHEMHKSAIVPAKIPKLTTNAVIEDIIIELPARAADRDAKRKSEKPKCLENGDCASKTKAAPLKTAEKQTKPIDSNSTPLNLSNTLNRPSSSRERNNKIVTLNSDDWKIPDENITVNGSEIPNNSKGAQPSGWFATVAGVVHDFFSPAKKVSENPTDSEANGAAKSPRRGGTSAIPSEVNLQSPKSVRPKVASKNDVDEAPNSRILSGNGMPKTLRIVDPKSSKISMKNSPKSNDERVAIGKPSELSEIEILDSVEAPKTRSSKNETPQAECSELATKLSKSSGDQSPIAESSEIVIVRSITSPRAGNSKIPNANEVRKISAESVDVETSRSNESPEIKIIDAPKIVPNAATDKKTKSCDVQESNSAPAVIKIVKEPVKEIKTRPMPRCMKMTSPSQSSNGVRLESVAKPPESPKVSSKVPQITSCEILSKDHQKISTLLNRSTAKPNISVERCTITRNDINSEKLSPKSQLHAGAATSKPIISGLPVVVVKRITPRRLLQSTNQLKDSKSNSSESSKSEKSDDSPDNSKESDAKIANDVSEKSSKISNGNNSKSNNSETTADSSESSKKSREIVTTTEIEPQPGCSKAPDIVDKSEKPQLVVKTKMPAYTANQDTFAMFLSLCLSIDRDVAMEKIVTKLKRYYDEMDPAYARSREFEELLYEKRERITESGKERVYWFTKHVMDEMKSRKVKRKNKATEGTDGHVAGGIAEEVSSANPPNEEYEEEEYEEDTSEARRRRRNIKKIDNAMKLCAKKIKKLEEAEVDFGVDAIDDSNSNYIKVDRYQAKMIQLWNKMCEYTNEHADAGRSYLRPKHLRVTPIPSVDHAINSFINSKLVGNRRKSKKRGSFIDGIIFPDYVDILECIGKVNDEQNLRLDKRSQENMARKAFVQLGEHLQTARKEDYYDTFSLNLEGSEDPAMKDAELKEKLERNEDINRTKMAEVLEEFAKKQQAAKTENRDENAAEDADDDDDEDEDEEEDDKKSNGDISDLELLEDDDDDDDCDKINDRNPSPQESINEEDNNENADVVESEITEDDTKTNEKTNNSPNENVTSPAKSLKVPIVQEEANENEVNLIRDIDEEANEPEGEKRSLLRIRSFAKPPDSWQSSQEITTIQVDSEASKSSNDASVKTKIIETIDVTDEDNKITVITKNSEKVNRLKTLVVKGKTVVVKPIDSNANRVLSDTPNAISAPRIIMIPTHSAPKNSSSIVDPPRYVSIKNSNNLPQLPLPSNSQPRYSSVPHFIRISQPGNSNSQSSHSTVPHFVRISQSGSSNSQPRLPNPSQQQINRTPQPPGHFVPRIPLNNAQLIRVRKATISENAQIPQTQIRAVQPQQQGMFPIVPNAQTPRGVLLQLKNGRYLQPTAVRQNPENSQSNNSQQSRIVAVTASVQQRRIAVPYDSRSLQGTQVMRRASQPQQMMQLKDGRLIAGASLPPDVKVSNYRIATVVSANNSPGKSTAPIPKLRTTDNLSTASTRPATSQGMKHPGDQNVRKS